MNEEFITKSIITYLKNQGWNIFSFDFPQSGTGFLIHPNNRLNKNKKAQIPDIIANKEDICIIMENKDHFSFDDFLKLYDLKTNDIYQNDLNRLKRRLKFSKILYGVGLPNNKNILDKILENKRYIDFCYLVDKNRDITFCSL